MPDPQKVAELQAAITALPKRARTPESDALIDRLRDKMDSAFDSEVGWMSEEEWALLAAAFPSNDPEEPCDIESLKSELWF